MRWRTVRPAAVRREDWDRVLIRPGVRVTFPWNVVIGDYCWIGDNVTLYSIGKITVGEHSVVSQEAYLCAATHDHAEISFPLVVAPIVIERMLGSSSRLRGAWRHDGAAQWRCRVGSAVGCRAGNDRGGVPARVVKRRESRKDRGGGLRRGVTTRPLQDERGLWSMGGMAQWSESFARTGLATMLRCLWSCEGNQRFRERPGRHWA